MWPWHQPYCYFVVQGQISIQGICYHRLCYQKGAFLYHKHTHIFLSGFSTVCQLLPLWEIWKIRLLRCEHLWSKVNYCETQQGQWQSRARHIKYHCWLRLRARINFDYWTRVLTVALRYSGPTDQHYPGPPSTTVL